jgi:transposase-like protein
MKGNDMTHPDQSTGELDPVQLILKHGLDGMRPAMELLLNLAMKAERSAFLGAESYERSPDREGYANGCKPKTLDTTLGKLQLAVPQTRGTAVPFYPDALERSQRSEKAFLLAIATMYVQGFATRRVTKVLEKLCGTAVSSSMVSRASLKLDEQLQAWRERQLSEVV